jgi:hypothetical protein
MWLIALIFGGIVAGGIWSQSEMASKIPWPDWLNLLFWNDERDEQDD